MSWRSAAATRSRKLAREVSRRPRTSRSVNAYIGRRTRRPVPGHICCSSSARTLPVSTNRPGLLSASTARFTAPRTAGTSCHSSRRAGSRKVRRAASGPAWKAAARAGWSRWTVSAQICRAVVVLPAARGPLTRTAGKLSTRSCRRLSTRRGRWQCGRTGSRWQPCGYHRPLLCAGWYPRLRTTYRSTGPAAAHRRQCPWH